MATKSHRVYGNNAAITWLVARRELDESVKWNGTMSTVRSLNSIVFLSFQVILHSFFFIFLAMVNIFLSTFDSFFYADWAGWIGWAGAIFLCVSKCDYIMAKKDTRLNMFER